MSLLHPKIESGYPDNCITVSDAIAGIEKVFADASLRVESFTIKAVTPGKGTMRLAFDRKKVGQAESVEVIP